MIKLMFKDPGLITIIISALFGGLASSLLTQHFFEQRERRKILLNKYQTTIESLNTVSDIIAEFAVLLDEVESDIVDHSSLSDTTNSLLDDFMNKFTYTYSSKYLIEINQIEIIQCYDNFFGPIAERYYKKAEFLYDHISDLRNDINDLNVTNIKVCGTAIDDFANLVDEFRSKLRIRIKMTVTVSIWKRAWEDTKSLFYRSNHKI